jgi:hypothetical protein
VTLSPAGSTSTPWAPDFEGAAGATPSGPADGRKLRAVDLLPVTEEDAPFVGLPKVEAGVEA